MDYSISQVTIYIDPAITVMSIYDLFNIIVNTLEAEFDNKTLQTVR